MISLQDIDRAIAFNYPRNLKIQLLGVQTSVAKLAVNQPNFTHEALPKLPKLRQYPQIQGAKNCIEIKEDDTFGRHVVASRDIQIGEIICIENPFASVITGDTRYLYCHHCFEVCYNPIPCTNCSQSVYCEVECRSNAQDYHKYECPILQSVEVLGVNRLSLLALKMAILAKREYDQDDVKAYYTSRFREILKLKGGKLSEEEEYGMAGDVVCLLDFMKKINFFNGSRSKDFFEDFKKTLVLLQRIVRLNVILICEDIYIKSKNPKFNVYGAAIYPFSSLFNHSCCNNVEFIHYGSTITCRAVNTIKKGQQCFISYG